MILLLAACVAPNEGFSGGGTPSEGGPDGAVVDDTSLSEDTSVEDTSTSDTSDSAVDTSVGDTSVEDTGEEDPDADRDLDGFTNGEERAAGSDPDACWSVPTGWPQCLAQAEADGVTGDGYRKGKVVPNFTMEDQNGQELQFHQFYSMVVIVDISAGWCAPCNESAATAEDFYVTYSGSGVLLVHLMTEDWYGQDADVAFLGEWASTHGLSFPVIREEEGVYEALYDEGYIEGIPSYFVYDRSMVLQETWSGHNEALMNLAVAMYK